jgi:hypothetical protein
MALIGWMTLACGASASAVAIILWFWRTEIPERIEQIDRLGMLGLFLLLASFTILALSLADLQLLALDWRDLSLPSRMGRIGVAGFDFGLLLWTLVSVCIKPGSRSSQRFRLAAMSVVIGGAILGLPITFVTYGTGKVISANELGAFGWVIQVCAWCSIVFGSTMVAVGAVAKMSTRNTHATFASGNTLLLTVGGGFLVAGVLITVTTMGMWMRSRGSGFDHIPIGTRLAEGVVTTSVNLRVVDLAPKAAQLRMMQRQF